MGNVCLPEKGEDGATPAAASTPSAPAHRGSNIVKPTVGSPAKLYPYVMLNGKPKELGSGAYSTVYEAVDKRSKQNVAVKRITKSNLQPHDHDALKNEVCQLSS